MELVREVGVDSFIIAMVSYTISVSMALIFATKLNYEIDFNQELLAMGVGNMVGSCFSCMPFAASLSRSAIQEASGGKTQLASLVSCGILTFVLLWIGPFFEDLPRVTIYFNLNYLSFLCFYHGNPLYIYTMSSNLFYLCSAFWPALSLLR